MDNLHQLNFASATAQHNYFARLPKKLNIEDDDYSYIRQDSVLRIGAHIDTLLEYNYVMYRNDNYSNKWFYAFITDMEYLNDNCTAITIKTDTWQTWQFDLTFKKCFVEREHVNDDTFGLHTIPEPLETGEYICNTTFDADYAKHDSAAAIENLVVVFQTTKVAFDNFTFPSNSLQVYGGIPQGCYMFGISYKEALETGRLNYIIGMYDGNGAADAIVSIFIAPKGVCEWTSQTASGSAAGSDTYLVPVASSSPSTISNFQTAFNDTLDGYTPKNKKCLTGQFNYLYVSNNGGTDITFNYENFIGNTCKFLIYGTLEQGGAVKLSPYNSKVSKRDGEYTSWTEGIEGVKLPMLSWASDFYLNWQAVNAKNIEVQTALTGISYAGNTALDLFSLASGQPTGGGQGLLGLASGLSNTLQTVKEAKMTPPQARGNVNGGGITFACNKSCFTFKKMSVRREYAEIIDNYFSQVGYKVNTVKVPNITGRQNWNYVKTIDVNILADIPQADLSEIKDMFNRGITIWHNPATFLDYNQSNNIV